MVEAKLFCGQANNQHGGSGASYLYCKRSFAYSSVSQHHQLIQGHLTGHVCQLFFSEVPLLVSNGFTDAMGQGLTFPELHVDEV